MNKIIKIIIISSVLFVILIFGLSYYAYKKLSPEQIKTLTIETLNNQFKNAKTQLGEVTLDFGLVFKIGFKGLKVENDKGNIFSIKELNARIPFYSVLFGAGAIDLNLEWMNIHYLETPTGSNWEMKPTEKKSEGNYYSVLLAGAKINLNIKDMSVSYALKSGRNGEFFLQEANFYKLNFLDKTAFGVKSNLKGKGYSFDAIGEGKIDLSKYWNEKIITGGATINFSDFKVEMVKEKIPTIKTNLTFFYDSQGKIKSEIQSFIGTEKILNSTLTYSRGLSIYDPLKLNIPMDKFMPSYGNISFKGNRINLEGKLSMTEKEMKPDLIFNWDAGPIMEEYKLSTKLKGKIKNNLMDLEIMANLSQGSEEISILGNGPIIYSENSIKIPKMNIRIGRGRGSFATQVKFIGNKKEGNFDAGFDGIDLKIFNPYFPKGIGAVTGILYGKFKGNFSKNEKNVTFSNSVFDLKALDGKIKEFNMEKHIEKVFSSVPFLFASKKGDIGSWVTGDFQILQLIGRMDKEKIFLDKMNFLGINKNIEIKGRGELSKTQNSQVFVEFIDHKGVISAPIKKYTGSNILRFKFIGSGYDLLPDYSYTVNSLGSDALKGHQPALEEAGKKLLDKLFKR